MNIILEANKFYWSGQQVKFLLPSLAKYFLVTSSSENINKKEFANGNLAKQLFKTIFSLKIVQMQFNFRQNWADKNTNKVYASISDKNPLLNVQLGKTGNTVQQK